MNIKINLAILALILSHCTHYSLSEDKAQYLNLSPKTETQSDSLLETFSPQLKVFDAHKDFNRIGKVIANEDGGVYIDSNTPVSYQHKQSFTIDDRTYTNLIYRVHFSEIPFSLFPFHLSKGKNVGLIFITTLNEKQQPVLFTATHSCGCYKAIIATPYTPENAFPEKWLKDNALNLEKVSRKQKVYGEKLPHILALNEENPNVCVSIKPQTHRIIDIHACNKNKNIALNQNAEISESNIPKTDHADTQALTSLRKLPSANGPVSFFHEEGIQEGFVKGAIKPWETILLSIPSLDFFVGTDKAYLRLDSNDNSFYTSLKPWNRTKTDMADFPSFLNYWGWSL